MVEALKAFFGSKALSSFSLYYAVSWAIYHWQTIYVTLFIDGSMIYKKFGMLKNEYVYKHFFDIHGLLGDYWRVIWIIGGYISPFIFAVVAI